MPPADARWCADPLVWGAKVQISVGLINDFITVSKGVEDTTTGCPRTRQVINARRKLSHPSSFRRKPAHLFAITIIWHEWNDESPNDGEQDRKAQPRESGRDNTA